MHISQKLICKELCWTWMIIALYVIMKHKLWKNGLLLSAFTNDMFYSFISIILKPPDGLNPNRAEKQEFTPTAVLHIYGCSLNNEE